jgi:hypothetical protein
MARLDGAVKAAVEGFPLAMLGQEPDAWERLTADLVLAISKAGFAIIPKDTYDALVHDAGLARKNH